ncbi:MAG: hypothetical protein ABSC93_01760 [Bryobacteraceae bacterium]|jgi:uncharacterized protein (TIGR03437 family)
MRPLYIYSLLALSFAAVAGAQIILDPVPARVVGHPATSPPEQLVITNVNPDFSANGGMYYPTGVALDTSGSSPILYVADTFNHRVLAWTNATSGTLSNQQAPSFVIGQPNSHTTLPAVNGGLYYPTGLMVDPKGNLYVVDSGNNRVVRYPAPVSGGNAAPDIVLGQPDKFTSNKANQGSAISAQTLCLYGGCPGGSGPYLASVAMDSSGNLFVVDAGNSRVLRFPAASLTSGAADPSSDLVIGQASFTKVTGPSGQTDRNVLYIPSGVAFDSTGNMFVTDGLSRMVVFSPSEVSGVGVPNGPPASRFAGIVSPTPATATASTLSSPNGIVMINNGPAVVDSGDNRVLIFDAFSSKDWTLTSPSTSYANPPPVAIAVLGQGSSLTNFTTSSANNGNPQASFSSNGTNIATMWDPSAAAIAGTDLFVVDTRNQRVLVYPNAGQAAAATVVLGQSGFPYNSPNSIHGQEFDFGSASAGFWDAGIAVDSSSGTPHLYISDPNNNRVLGFADARGIGPGVQASIAIGQIDLNTGICNYGGVTNPAAETLPRQPTQSSLCYPTGLAVDPATGDLYVADSSNGRVLRFPAPFAPGNSAQQANLVLGQSAFTGISNPQAGPAVMVFPYGLVFDPARGLLVSDEAANRVLLFQIDSTTQNGETASTVFGQPDFTSTGTSVLNSPHHIAEDSIAEVYVADTRHNQIQVFNIPSSGSTDTPINTFTGLNSPQAIWVNQNTVAGYQNDIWVGDSNYGISRYPVPNPLVTGNTASLTMPAAEVTGPSITCGGSLCQYPPLALTQDSFGALYVADTSNRVAVHYPALTATNGASFVCAMGCDVGGLLEQPYYLAPGAYGSLFPYAGLSLPVTATSNYVLPVPTTLGGIQVLVSCPAGTTCPPNGQPSAQPFTQGFAFSPLTYVASGQINFVVPWEAPTSGTAQLEVVNPTTSQVVASGTLAMNSAAPAFFIESCAAPCNNPNGQTPAPGQVAALNCNLVNNACDNTVNGTAHPADPGSTIQLFLTGQGSALNSAPPADGQADCGALTTGPEPEVIIGTTIAKVTYSGLAPCYVGLWQINAVVPTNPGQPPTGFPNGVFPVLVDFNGLVSDPSTNIHNPSLATTIVINAPQ